MRFRSRAEVLVLSLAALLPAALVSSSPAHAQLKYAQLPQSQPRVDMNWSEARKPRKAGLTQLRSRLNEGDAFATLNALHIALSTLGDGQTYAWGRPKRQLRTLITPTASFRDTDGRVCRKLTVTFALGSYMKRTEAVACRGGDKGWEVSS